MLRVHCTYYDCSLTFKAFLAFLMKYVRVCRWTILKYKYNNYTHTRQNEADLTGS
jgi:hypothetical protein